jgi:hypothetical protein
MSTGVRARWWLPYALIVFVGLLAHHGALWADFYMDDHGIITGRSGTTGVWHTRWRQVPRFLFWVTGQVGGKSSMVYHVWNLGIHLGISCLIYRVGRDLFRHFSMPGSGRAQAFAALAGALVFSCHPMTSEAVHYARCVMIQLVTLFTVLAVWGMVRFAGDFSWKDGVLVVVGITGATLSKDPGVFQALGSVGIAVLALAQWDLVKGMARRRITGKQMVLGLPVILFLAYFCLFWAQWVFRQVFLHSDLLFPHGLTQARIFWEYGARVIWPYTPFELSSDHYVAWSQGWGDVSAVVQLTGIVILGLTGVVLVLRKSQAGRLVGMLMLLALLPVLMRFGYTPKELMIEYRVYPAMPWVGLIAGLGLALVWQRSRWLGVGLAVVVIGTSILMTVERSRVWRSEESLARDVWEQYPLNMRALTQLQGIAYRAGNYDRVIELREDVVKSFQESEAYNREHVGVRGYDMTRVHENLSNAEQVITYALDKRDGPEAALAYANGVLGVLVKSYPALYINPDTGQLFEGNALVRVRKVMVTRVQQKAVYDKTKRPGE